MKVLSENRNLKISVIIPIYNTESYLHKCINSVIIQGYKNLEIILVNDGSTDNSPVICEEFSVLDARVKVIHKTNSGLSDARNAGIKVAQGEYLMFLDSDDYWESERSLETIVNHLDQVNDVVVFGAKSLYQKRGVIVPDRYVYNNSINHIGRKDILTYLVGKGLFIGSACTKAIKSSFLKHNNLYFKPGIRSEDIEWSIRLMNCMPHYYFSNEQFYIYRRDRKSSITNTVDSIHLNQYREFLYDAYLNESINDSIRFPLLSFIAYHYLILGTLVNNLKHGTKKDLQKLVLSDFKEIRENNLHPKVRRFNLVSRFLGVRISFFLLGFYLRMR